MAEITIQCSMMCICVNGYLPSMFWYCWLGSRKGIRPVKNWVVGCLHGICLDQGADLHMAQLMSLPLTVSCSSKSRLVLPSWFYLSGAGSPGWSRTKSKRAVKWLYVCVCVIHLEMIAFWAELSNPVLNSATEFESLTSTHIEYYMQGAAK